MTFEQEAAYALAAWDRFDDAISDDLLRALTSAFALVAVADGDLARSEVDQFLVLMREHTEVFAPLDFDQMGRGFRDLTGALLTDPTAGRSRALALIRAVNIDSQHCELVRAAAQIAAAADNRSVAAERDVLSEICAALGLSD